MLAPAERTEWREKHRDTEQERAEKREREMMDENTPSLWK